MSGPIFHTSQAWNDYIAFAQRENLQDELNALRPPTLFDTPPKFDGATYEREHDEYRLTGQLLAVHNALQDGRPHTLAELRALCGGSEAGISARLRDLKKAEYQAHDVRKRRAAQGAGLYEYWLATACQCRPNEP